MERLPGDPARLGVRTPGRRTLILLRHGQTEWNALGRGQGHCDVPLDDLGHAQAAAVAPYLAKLRPVGIWSSDLSRAADTASYVAAACGLLVTVDERFREFDLGERTGLTMPEFEARFPAEYLAFRQGRYEGVPGSESVTQVSSRFGAALREVVGAIDPGECAVVVAHGTALRVSVAALLGWAGAGASTLGSLENCAWAVLDDSGPETSMSLRAWNRTATC